MTGVRSFLGFANFYYIFIKNYSDLALPLTRRTQKGAAFRWDKYCEQVFQKLKTIFIEVLILVQFNPDLETIIETDSSS